MDAYAATRLALDVASALRALHRQGALHRDVKPDKILRDDAGRHLLTDLGVARVDAIAPERFDAPTRIRQWQGIALVAVVVAILEAIALLAR